MLSQYDNNPNRHLRGSDSDKDKLYLHSSSSDQEIKSELVKCEFPSSATAQFRPQMSMYHLNASNQLKRRIEGPVQQSLTSNHKCSLKNEMSKPSRHQGVHENSEENHQQDKNDLPPLSERGNARSNQNLFGELSRRK